MEIESRRFHFAETFTVSHLFIDSQDTGFFIIEDAVREIEGKPVSEWKIDGKTAIPYGRQKVIINMSTRFKKLLPLLLEVVGFKGVRCHTGNDSGDTEGCLIPGTHWDGKSDWLSDSKTAFTFLYNKIDAALKNGEEVYWTICKE